MLPQDKLDLILRRHAEISARLAAGHDSALSRELSGLEDVAAAIRDYRTQVSEVEGLEAMLGDPATEAEMRDLAEDELRDARDRLSQLEH